MLTFATFLKYSVKINAVDFGQISGCDFFFWQILSLQFKLWLFLINWGARDWTTDLISGGATASQLKKINTKPSSVRYCIGGFDITPFFMFACRCRASLVSVSTGFGYTCVSQCRKCWLYAGGANVKLERSKVYGKHCFRQVASLFKAAAGDSV